jgi:hypothetical protein
MGPPNTSTISPATSQYVDPVTGIYLGPPTAPKTSNSTAQPMFTGFNTQQQRINPNPMPYRDPEHNDCDGKIFFFDSEYE